MRHVEAHPVGPGIRRQVWFATRPVGEEQRGRVHVDITPEELPQQSSRTDEALPVAREVEAIGSSRFVRREEADVRAHRQSVEDGDPDVHLARAGFQRSDVMPATGPRLSPLGGDPH